MERRRRRFERKEPRALAGQSRAHGPRRRDRARRYPPLGARGGGRRGLARRALFGNRHLSLTPRYSSPNRSAEERPHGRYASTRAATSRDTGEDGVAATRS